MNVSNINYIYCMTLADSSTYYIYIYIYPYNYGIVGGHELVVRVLPHTQPSLALLENGIESVVDTQYTCATVSVCAVLINARKSLLRYRWPPCVCGRVYFLCS